MKRLFASLLLLLSMAAVAAPQGHLQTFPLRNRAAEEMVELLRPMFPDLTLTGTGYTVVARGSFEELTKLEEMLEDLDTAPAQLLVTVRTGRLSAAERREIGVGGRISEREAEGRVRVYETERRREAGANQQLRVLEGNWARIEAGRSVPLAGGSVVQGPRGPVVYPSLEYRDLTSGFEVRPRLAKGEIVTLDIRPFSAHLAREGRGAVDTQEIATTVSGRLGEWIQLGGAAERERRSGSGTLYSTGERREETADIFVKIERIE